MTKIDATQDRQYPEQFDKNLLCTHGSGGFRFPARASIAMAHLLARGNAQDVTHYDAIVIGVDKREGQPFISMTLDLIMAIQALDYLMHRLVESTLQGKDYRFLRDADPDSSPRGES